MRMIKGWTEDAKEELKMLKSVERSVSEILEMIQISSFYTEDLKGMLDKKMYDTGRSRDEIGKVATDFILDISQFLSGTAKFEERLYYIQIIPNDAECYVNRYIQDDSLIISGKVEIMDKYKTKFTMDEIKAIDPRYVPFAIKVGTINEIANYLGFQKKTVNNYLRRYSAVGYNLRKCE
ncbi:hypothetical protein [Companilactobacillus allii]|nr:hypothetical protein [Companilactobacillus allii]